LAQSHSFIGLFGIGLSRESVLEIQEQSQAFYKKSFFTGTIGLGYLIIFVSCFEYEISYVTKKEMLGPHDFVVVGVAFIMTGILVKAHGIMKYLIREKLEQKDSSNPAQPDR